MSRFKKWIKGLLRVGIIDGQVADLYELESRDMGLIQEAHKRAAHLEKRLDLVEKVLHKACNQIEELAEKCPGCRG
jgi:hypothetical protein